MTCSRNPVVRVRAPAKFQSRDWPGPCLECAVHFGKEFLNPIRLSQEIVCPDIQGLALHFRLQVTACRDDVCVGIQQQKAGEDFRPAHLA